MANNITSFENTLSLIRSELTNRINPNWRGFMVEGGIINPNTVLLFHIFPNTNNLPDMSTLSENLQNQLRISGYVTVTWRSRNFRNYRVSTDPEVINRENELFSRLMLSLRDTLSPFFNFEVETFIDENGEAIQIERA